MGAEKNDLPVRQILTDPVLFAAFGFGSGLTKYAPGTMGTLAAIPVYWLLIQTGELVYSLITILICLTGIWICGHAAEKLRVHDHPGIVWDEIAGYLVTMWVLPFSWQWIIAGFVMFRVFDIFKPWPIRQIDRNLGGGLGIMLDDLLAAVFASVSLLLIDRFFLNGQF